MTDAFILLAYTMATIITLLGTTFLVWASIEFTAVRGEADYTSDVRTIIFVYAVNTIILAVTAYSHIVDYVRA
jgi:hypothetical protein